MIATLFRRIFLKLIKNSKTIQFYYLKLNKNSENDKDIRSIYHNVNIVDIDEWISRPNF